MLRSHNYYQEPLYATYFDYDKERRHAFTWIPKKDCDDTCIWKLKPVDG
jgi:hypothetical protein